MKSIITVSGSPVTVWKVSNTQVNVVIAHGMMEHADRYADFADELNTAGISVYAIHHLGHGLSNEFEQGHWPKNGFQLCVDRMADLVTHVRTLQPDIPVFMLGHSMGSFLAQKYISENPQIKGLILSGTNGPSLMVHVGSVLASLLLQLNDAKSESPFLHHMSFDPFQKPFQPNRTSCDWLSRDSEQVDAYVQDNKCGFVCTHGFYDSFMRGLTNIHRKKVMMNIPKSLPIYLFSGSMDPVGNFGKGVTKLSKMYLGMGMTDITTKLYLQGRHEMINEINRKEVYRDVIDWILSRR